MPQSSAGSAATYAAIEDVRIDVPMTLGEARVAGLAFAVLTATVGVNLFVFQEKRAVRIETSAISPMTSGVASSEAQDAKSIAQFEPSNAAPGTAPLPQAVQPVATPGISQAEIIRGVQRELTARGYAAGQPDGIIGLVTRAAIMAYEHDFGLALTAEASEDLLNRIVLGASGQAEMNRAEPDVILSAQAKSVVRMVTQGLTAQGYKPGADTGTLSPDTRRAILDFETAQKLPETGRISAPLVSRLLKLQAQAPVASAGKGRTAQR